LALFAVPEGDVVYNAVSQSDLTSVDDYVDALGDPIHRDAASIIIRSPEEVWRRRGCLDRTGEAIPRVGIGMKKYEIFFT
jgi:hypothetical protein